MTNSRAVLVACDLSIDRPSVRPLVRSFAVYRARERRRDETRNFGQISALSRPRVEVEANTNKKTTGGERGGREKGENPPARRPDEAAAA